MATGLTGVWNMGWRTAMMWRIFKIHPFSKGWFTVAGIALLVGLNPLVSDAPDVALELGTFGQVVMAVLRGGSQPAQCWWGLGWRARCPSCHTK